MFDFHDHLCRQREWSEKTFGPGDRRKGVIDHIRKELAEIEASDGELAEWIDVVILSLDGAWRSGASPYEIINALVAKQMKNEKRKWPDWRTMPADKAIEHDRAPPASAFAERGNQMRYTPANCPHCEYDRRFPGFEDGGWMQQENNGPIVSCPLCNDDGKYPRDPFTPPVRGGDA